MNFLHDVCMVVSWGVVSLGSFFVLCWKVGVEWLLGYLGRFEGRFLGLFCLRLGV